MSAKVDNNAYELVITPNKRKRANDENKQPTLKTSSFSANYDQNKENHFVYNNFMEVKSIADILAEKKNQSNNLIVDNSYEVSRKPPKKRSKCVVEDGCFANPALNLNVPEKLFNPFEVKREQIESRNNHCFVNSGLNVLGAEREVRNPFEISREEAPPKEIKGKSFK